MPGPGLFCVLCWKSRVGVDGEVVGTAGGSIVDVLWSLCAMANILGVHELGWAWRRPKESGRR